MLRAEEMWGPTLTLWERSDRKPLIQRQVEHDRPRSSSLVTSLLGLIVFNAELKSIKNIYT